MAQVKEIPILGLRLGFHGKLAALHRLDLYDSAKAMLGMHRVIAITSHAVMHGEIITQAPRIRGARVDCVAPREGSWTVDAQLIGLVIAGSSVLNAVMGTMVGVGAAKRDSVLGWLTFSALDYLIRDWIRIN